jgi:hypothetical protein
MATQPNTPNADDKPPPRPAPNLPVYEVEEEPIERRVRDDPVRVDRRTGRFPTLPNDGGSQ